MKGLLISIGVGLGVAAICAVKAIDEDRQECVSQEGDIKVVTKESFSQAAKRKVNEITAWVSFKKAVKEKINKILNWVSTNTEKVENMIKTMTIVTTVAGVASAGIELYSSTKRLMKDPDEELVNEVREINARLRYLTPEIEIESF